MIIDFGGVRRSSLVNDNIEDGDDEDAALHIRMWASIRFFVRTHHHLFEVRYITYPLQVELDGNFGFQVENFGKLAA